MKKLILLIGFNMIISTAFSQWQQVNNGIYGGDADCLAASGNNLFAGNNGAGVFLSKDNGANWSKINNGLTDLNVTSLEATESSIFIGTQNGGVFRSNNNGNSWEEVNNGISSIAISGTNIFVGGRSVYISSNNGESWKELKSLSSRIESDGVSTLFVSGTKIFVGSGGGNIFKSSDNGETWSQIATKITQRDITSIIAVGDNILVGTSMEGLFLSINNGETWSKVNSLPCCINKLITDGSKIFVATEVYGVFCSLDNGITWTVFNYNEGLAHGSVQALAIKDENLFAGTSHGGVYISDNYEKKWIRVNNGYTAFLITSVKVSGTNLFAGTAGGDIFLSKDNGQSWYPVMSTGSFGLNDCEIRDIEVSGTNLYVATASSFKSAIFFSSTNGNTWVRLPAIHMLFSLAISGSDIFASTFFGIFYSKDNCQSWNDVSSGLTGGYYPDIAISGTDIFTAGYNDVFISSNKGTNWTTANSGITTPWIDTFFVLDTTVFAGTWGRGIFRYSKYNAKWEQINTGLTSFYVKAFAASGSNIFAGVSEYFGRKEGVFMSTNNGTNWIDIDNDLVNNVSSLTVSDTFLYAGTWYEGIWRRPLTEILTTNNQSISNNLLYQIFPNPSKDGIFQIENINIDKTELSIYDVNSKLLYKTLLLGKEIKKIDLSGNSKGLYFIRFSNGKVNKTEKLIIE